MKSATALQYSSDGSIPSVYQEKSFHIKGSLEVKIRSRLEIVVIKIINMAKEVMPMVKKLFVSMSLVIVILQIALSISVHIQGEGRLTLLHKLIN